MLRLIHALAALLLLTASAFAQQGSLVQQSATRLDAGNNVATGTFYNTVNHQSVATITVPSGLYAYLTGLAFDICGDTTGTVATNVNFTSSGIVGAPTWGYSASAANSLSTCTRIQENFATPLKSATPGTNVVVTSPAGEADTGYAIRLFYYLAP